MLIGLGVVALSLAVIVFVLNQNTASDLLAALGLVGGLAIIVNELPDNGSGENHRGQHPDSSCAGQRQRSDQGPYDQDA